MVIRDLNSTHCANDVFNRHLQTCASNLVADVSQSTQHNGQDQHPLRRLPNRDRQRYVPGAIQHIGSLQSPFNAHTSTAPAG
jgi:hypothetical protein